ncbi:hypothetical protein [Mesorhizobium sp. NPDC059025]|uniref:hypothetical protein n=1 Tax=unclassified Mesorhizobium TaxID=325217 RepID=UPI003687E0F7
MTTNAAIDMSKANHLPARGDELLRVVTRFEYALKENGFGKSGKNGEVGVDWDGFANKALKATFLKKVRDENIAPTILAKPPSKQILAGQTLAWENATPPVSVQDLMAAVRRVRNNLVHGGKSGNRDSDRNNTLVAEAIEVLLEALRSDSDLRYTFEGRW